MTSPRFREKSGQTSKTLTVPRMSATKSAEGHPLPMQKRSTGQSAFLNPRTLIVLLLSSIKTGAIHIALLCAAALSVHAAAIALGKPAVPSDGIWTVTGSLNTGRFEYTATLLPNGMVLVAGGFDSNNNVLATAELYDPANGSWSATGGLNTARADHTATLLPNGMVLVAGGVDSSGYSTSAELYDPMSGSWTATGSLNTARADHTCDLVGQRCVACCRWSGQRRRSHKRGTVRSSKRELDSHWQS